LVGRRKVVQKIGDKFCPQQRETDGMEIERFTKRSSEWQKKRVAATKQW
jgi:hypothetical protein